MVETHIHIRSIPYRLHICDRQGPIPIDHHSTAMLRDERKGKRNLSELSACAKSDHQEIDPLARRTRFKDFVSASGGSFPQGLIASHTPKPGSCAETILTRCPISVIPVCLIGIGAPRSTRSVTAVAAALLPVHLR